MTIKVKKSVEDVVTFNSDELHLLNDALVHYLDAMMYMPLSFKNDSLFQKRYDMVAEVNNKISDLILK